MSLTKSQQARLGIFMSAGALLLALFIIVPLGLSLKNHEKSYFAYFEGESLSGLEQGATLKFRGVPIGKVGKISYDPRDLTRVKVEFKVQEDFPVKTDMYVQTGAMGITGLKYVELMGGTNESALLKPNSQIPARISLISTITGKAEVMIGKVELLLNHLNTITDPDSIRSIRKILDNVAVISQEARGFVSETRPDIKQITASVLATVQRADSIVRDVKHISGSVDQSISDGQLLRILTSVDSTARSLKMLSDDMSLTIKQSREDFNVSMENLREALENANELMRALAENPSLLLRGEQKQRDAR